MLKWLCALLGLCGTSAGWAASVNLTPVQQTVGLNSTAVLDLAILYDIGEPTTLFSFGARLDVSGPGNVTAVSIVATSELNFFGTRGPGAFIDSSPNIFGVKGSVDVLGTAEPYGGQQIARFFFNFDQPGDYEFTPRIFNTLGPTESVFVAGNGLVLDDGLTFSSSVVSVVPEPGIAVLALFAGVPLLLRRRNQRLLIGRFAAHSH